MTQPRGLSVVRGMSTSIHFDTFAAVAARVVHRALRFFRSSDARLDHADNLIARRPAAARSNLRFQTAEEGPTSRFTCGHASRDRKSGIPAGQDE